MGICLRHVLHPFELPEQAYGEEQCDQEGRGIRKHRCIQCSDDTRSRLVGFHDHRDDDDAGAEEEDITAQGSDGCLKWLSAGLEEDGRHLDETCEDGRA